MEIKRVSLPLSGFEDLADEAPANGHLFLKRMKEEWMNGSNQFTKPGEFMLGAFEGSNLIGVGGLNICPYSNDVRIGRLRHLYVRSDFRNRGIARQLIAEILDATNLRFDQIRLRTQNPAAIELYKSLGFTGSPHPQASHEYNL